MRIDKIPILIIISGLDIGGVHGGAERFGIELARHLDHSKYQIYMCAFWKKGGTVEQHWHQVLTEERISVFYASEWGKKRNPISYFLGILNTLKFGAKHHMEITHSHFQVGTLTAISLKKLGYTRKAIRTAHINFEWGRGFQGWLCRQFFTKWIYPLTLDKEVGVSQAIVNILSNYPGSRLLKKKPQVIYNAIDIDYIVSLAGESINITLPPESLILGSAGRLTTQKGYSYLIDAMVSILQYKPNVYLLLVGDGDLYEKLKLQAIQGGLGDHVIFWGKSQNPFALIKRMKLFILPSLWEGLPTVILESMACGVPVISTDIPGVTELISNRITGWLVKPKDAAELSTEILRVLHSPSEMENVRLAATETVNHFSIYKIAMEYQNLYNSL